MRTLVAIPAFNEARTVADVVREVREYRPDDTILVIDDGSHDATAQQAAAQDARVVHHPSMSGGCRHANRVSVRPAQGL